MRIDFASLAFGYSIKVGGGTPNWATSLGQSREREYRINDDPEINELIKGLTYKSVSLSRISTKIGKGGRMYQGNLADSPIILAALFDKVYINKTLIENGKYIILVTRDTSESHTGRLRFKYGPSNTYTDENGNVFSNDLFWEKVKSQLELASDACFFVYDISIYNQDELHMKTVVVAKDGPQSYYDANELHSVWEQLVSENNEKYGWTDLPASPGDDNDFTNNHPYINTACQCIFYGVPGSGKSYRIDEITSDKSISSFQKRRVVFHPDYTNADFVGQIMPVKNGDNISYDFKEGPFTSILKAACSKNNTDKPFYLIVEEINRGNAAAIFGDMFQLLDRREDGWSRYEITNEEVCKIVYENAKERDYKIQLPPNLSILATMNTSDQNVFTLDNAFQRRWNMVHVKNTFDEDNDSKKQRDAIIEGTTLTWGHFLFGSPDGIVTGINTIISESANSSGMSSLEDKRLGCWFVVNKDGKIKKDDFSNKVLKYLWDDAFRLDKAVFADGISGFDELVDAFEAKKPLFRELIIPYEE